ncbi:MAG: D-alanine--D-alanine ligase A [Sulfobacillus benefaciens]|uniref:D-alanine--D-alanine ligase n=1 Tax=Sulfobacillus benefaciens TaxID=453960 RepID=A0A2T2X7M2_9FIRM|nr:MAG: D-alanine--D-alanine ligase A [Sulfobacillus benefaciens]
MALRVGVLFGGQSEEHDVSMMSAYAVMEALVGTYEIVPMAIDKMGRWMAGDAALDLMRVETGRAPVLPSFVRSTENRRQTPQAIDGRQVPFRPETFTGLMDVVIPVLHGPLGEDGTVQGLLELVGLPYVGSGVLGSALGMDKIAMKIMLGAMGIPQVAYYGLSRHEWIQERTLTLDHLEKSLAYPMFVKPANLGSSIGISKATHRMELEVAIDTAQQFDRRIIIEHGVDAREFEVGVLGWYDAEASVVGEVTVHGHDFYDYAAKYQDSTTDLSIPANIPCEVAQTMRQLAVKAFHILDCAGLARVDFFWEERSGMVFLNEINTLPGFTPYSMYPVLWEVTGVPYSQLLDRLIAIAIERHQQQSRRR